MLGICAAANVAQAQSLADSVADFSGVQGHGGWYYGFYDGDVVTPYHPSDFELMASFDSGLNGEPPYWHNLEGPGGYFSLIRASRVHPNGRFTSGGRVAEDQWVVRRWVSTFNGSVRVRASFVDLNTSCGNGIRAHIFLGSSEVYSHIVNSLVEQVFEMDLCVSIGTIIDFAVDPLESWDSCDNTGVTVSITGPITADPVPVRSCLGGTSSMSVEARGSGNINYTWRKNKLPLQDGPHYSGVNTPTLSVLNARVADQGMYDCVASVCGGAFASAQAELSICYADYNCDGSVNSQDFFDFISGFMSEDPRVDSINLDGYVNSQDLMDFIAAFFAGCN